MTQTEGAGERKGVAQTACVATRRRLVVLVRSSYQRYDSGSEHIQETCYKQLVSCNVEGQLHETSSPVPDIEKAKCVHRI